MVPIPSDGIIHHPDPNSQYFVVPLDFHNPGVIQWNFAVQRALPGHFNLDVAYAIARSPIGGQVTSRARVAANSDVLFRIDDEGEPVDLSRGLDFAVVGSGSENPNLHQLGVEISRQLLRALGGTFMLENREPQGLSIAVKLPAHVDAIK